MPIQYKIGPLGSGSWSAPTASGKLFFKRPPWEQASGWYSPGIAYVKIGDYGGGVWKDLGYRGYPLAPSTPWVHEWDNSSFSWVSINWSGPGAGGAPTVSYDEEQLNWDGTRIAYYEGIQAPSGRWNAGEDGAYYFRVRSRSAAGLVSPWSGNLYVRMGHTEQGHNELRGYSRYWDTGGWSGYVLKDQTMGYNVRGEIYIQGMHWRNLRFPGGQFVSPSNTPPNSRFVRFIVYNIAYGWIHDAFSPPIVYSGSNHDHALGNWAEQPPAGAGYLWGIRPEGSGWSTGGNPGLYALWADNFWISGTYYWNEWVYVKTRDYLGNVNHW